MVRQKEIVAKQSVRAIPILKRMLMVHGNNSMIYKDIYDKLLNKKCGCLGPNKCRCLPDASFARYMIGIDDAFLDLPLYEKHQFEIEVLRRYTMGYNHDVLGLKKMKQSDLYSIHSYIGYLCLHTDRAGTLNCLYKFLYGWV